MTGMIWKATASLALGAAAVTAAATPAQAQYRSGWNDGRSYYYGDRNRYRHRDRDRTGVAIAAGVAGLAIGAALASRNDGRYYRGRGYYDDGYYYRDRRSGYYPRYRYRDHPRYYRGNRYGYRGCVTRRVYDPYLGRRVRVRYC